MRMRAPTWVKTPPAASYSAAFVNKIVIKHGLSFGISGCTGRTRTDCANRGMVAMAPQGSAISARSEGHRRRMIPVTWSAAARYAGDGSRAYRLRHASVNLMTCSSPLTIARSIRSSASSSVGLEFVGHRRAAAVTGVEPAPGLPGVAECGARGCITDVRSDIAECGVAGDAMDEGDPRRDVSGVGEVDPREHLALFRDKRGRWRRWCRASRSPA